MTLPRHPEKIAAFSPGQAIELYPIASMIKAAYDVRQPTIMIRLGETIHGDALVYLGRSMTASLRTKHSNGMARLLLVVWIGF
jgi:hypothetical protein